MPKILIIGDSISIGYTPTVAAELADVAEVVHSPGNASDCMNIIANIDAWLAEAAPQVVALNCGLHDIKREDEKQEHCRVPVEFYKTILPAIFEKAQGNGRRLLWVNTTPVIEKRHQAVKPSGRFNKDIDEHNKAARGIARKAGLPIVNLNKTVRKMDMEAVMTEDGAHFLPGASEALGKKVAARLREML